MKKLSQICLLHLCTLCCQNDSTVYKDCLLFAEKMTRLAWVLKLLHPCTFMLRKHTSREKPQLQVTQLAKTKLGIL